MRQTEYPKYSHYTETEKRRIYHPEATCLDNQMSSPKNQGGWSEARKQSLI